MRLHDRIMNIAVASDFDYADFPNKVYAYKSGHRDARHAAAEMALIADELLDALVPFLDFADRELDLHGEVIPESIIEAARDAIYKARGM